MILKRVMERCPFHCQRWRVAIGRRQTSTHQTDVDGRWDMISLVRQTAVLEVDSSVPFALTEKPGSSETNTTHLCCTVNYCNGFSSPNKALNDVTFTVSSATTSRRFAIHHAKFLFFRYISRFSAFEITPHYSMSPQISHQSPSAVCNTPLHHMLLESHHHLSIYSTLRAIYLP